MCLIRDAKDALDLDMIQVYHNESGHVLPLHSLCIFMGKLAYTMRQRKDLSQVLLNFQLMPNHDEI